MALELADQTGAVMVAVSTGWLPAQRGRHVRTGDFDCFYHDDYFGPAWRNPEVVLLQHGFSRNTDHWRAWVPHLAGRFRVIRRDTRGHGGSAAGDRDHSWSIDAMARDVLIFLDAMDIERVHFVGEMTGGSTGLALAAAAPARVSSLTLVQSPIDLGHATKVIAGAQPRPDGRPVATPWADDPLRGEWETLQRGRCDPQVIAAITRSLPASDLRRYLPQITAPTLICAPADHPAMPISGQIEMQQAITGARMLTYRGDILVDDVSAECCAALVALIDHTAAPAEPMT